MKVSDIMTFGVATVHESAPLELAATTMLTHGISCLPVVGASGDPAGIITDGDIVRKIAERAGRPGQHISECANDMASMSVSQAMSAPVQTVDRDCLVEDALRKMLSNQFRALPVTLDGKFVGMLSRPDLIRYVLDLHD